MYDSVDRPLASLDRGGQLMVWSMRRWMKDSAGGGSACMHICPAFRSYRIADALPQFDAMMVALRDTMREPLVVGGDVVTEHEAIVLGLLKQISTTAPSEAVKTAGALVTVDGALSLADALNSVGECLIRQGLFGRYSQWFPAYERPTK